MSAVNGEQGVVQRIGRSTSRCIDPYYRGRLEKEEAIESGVHQGYFQAAVDPDKIRCSCLLTYGGGKRKRRVVFLLNTGKVPYATRSGEVHFRFSCRTRGNGRGERIRARSAVPPEGCHFLDHAERWEVYLHRRDRKGRERRHDAPSPRKKQCPV